MTKNELQKIVNTEFLKSLESSAKDVKESIKKYSDENGNIDSASLAAFCLNESTNIACAAVQQILEAVLPLDG